MGAKTNIEWTDATWNPIRGCSRVSEGCRNCYAELMAARFSQPGQWGEGLAVMQHGKPRWTGKVDLVEKHLLDPLKWKTPRRIFVNSLSDLFHENVTDEMRDRIFAVMGHCSQLWYRCTARECDHYACDENKLRSMEPHVFQVLTKRPERMLEYLSSADRRERIIDAWDLSGWYFENPPIEHSVWPLPNLWLGVSVENQAAADERIPLLLQTPAAVRFLSCEPLLGEIDLGQVPNLLGVAEGQRYLNTLKGYAWEVHGPDYYDVCNIGAQLAWVICGGESGPGARPMHPGWARSLRDQCQDAGVPFFFKQWGEWIPRGPESLGYPSIEGVARMRITDSGENGQDLAADGENQVWMQRVGKHSAGALLDGREWKEFPR